MNLSKAQLALLGIAFGILLALLIAPQTRWVVRAQLAPISVLPLHYDRQRLAFIQDHPNDYQVQLGGQASSDTRNQSQYERGLVPRFPDNASLRANILRNTMLDNFQVSSPADYLLSGQPAPTPRHQDVPPSPAQFAAFDADAAAGERLDPDNAYFPFMRSVGYYAAHRDAEGLAAVRRASTKHRWQEYYEDGVEGRWRINDAVYGGREAISAAAVSAATLFPHYASLRAVARIVGYHALLEEQTGHPEEGLAERKALGRCGELMATQSTTIIGSLVGSAINMISRTRPGGAPPLKFNTEMPAEQQAQKRLDLYCTYVTKIGHPEAASEAQRDYQTWQQIHRVTSKIDLGILGIGGTNITHLLFALLTGWVLFLNIVSVVLLGLAGAGLSRLPRVLQRRPLPAGATVGFWVIALISFLLVLIFFNAGPAEFTTYVPLLVAAPLVSTALIAFLLPRLRRPLLTALLTAGITIGLTGLFGLLAFWQLHGGGDFIAAVQELNGTSESDFDPNVAAWDNTQVKTLLGAVLGLTVPVLIAIVLSIVSRVKRVPVSVGLVNGFRAVMPPLVCALMLVYGGLVLWTVQQEARANYGLERSLHGEGQYLAQITGQAWPKE